MDGWMAGYRNERIDGQSLMEQELNKWTAKWMDG